MEGEDIEYEKREPTADDMDNIKLSIRKLFNVPNPLNEGLMRKPDVEALCEALKWDPIKISKACRANQYGVIDCDDFEKMMLFRFKKNFGDNPDGYLAKIETQIDGANLKIHPPEPENPWAEEEALRAAEALAEGPTVFVNHDPTYDMRNRMHVRHASHGVMGQTAVAPEDVEGYEGPAMSSVFSASKAGAGTDQAPRMRSPHDASSHEYRCPKCRYVLFVSADVEEMDDSEASGQKSIKGKNWNKGGMPSLDDNVDITSLFLTGDVAEPMLGEDAYSGVDSGKLYCPKCSNKVGHFKWSGEQDNRGRFHCPSFNVPKSRVDCMPIRRAAAPVPAPAMVAAPPQELLEGEDI